MKRVIVSLFIGLLALSTAYIAVPSTYAVAADAATAAETTKPDDSAKPTETPKPADSKDTAKNKEFKITVDPTSAWFDEEKMFFGAGVIINDGAYECISYRLLPRSGHSENVYQRKGKESNPWVYIGSHGPGKQDYHFPSDTSVKIFIAVSDACAKTKGYDHMF